MNIALDTNFSIPGDATFPLNQAFEAPGNRQDAETLRQYLSQVRQELAMRLLQRVYTGGNTPSKVSHELAMLFKLLEKANYLAVVAELHEEEVYGEIFVAFYLPA